MRSRPRTRTRRFSLLEITSGLSDDSREEDEREEERRLRDLRGRVKAAREVVATTPGLAEILRGDWKRAAKFYARYGITEGILRNGVPTEEAGRIAIQDFTDKTRRPCDGRVGTERNCQTIGP